MSDAKKSVGRPEGQFSPDQPISATSEDLLDRAQFLAHLTSALKGWSSQDSLVIGLHAPWGKGKTSVKNLLLEELKNDSDLWSVVDFNPWQWSSYGNLNDAFFDEVAVGLGNQSRSKSRGTANSWRVYAAKLKGVSSLSGALVSPVQTSLLAVSFLALFGVAWPHKILLAILFVCLVIASATKFTAPLLDAIAEIIAPSKKELEPSLETLRNNLATALRQESRKILVIVDDIDRLAPKALAEMIQLVKANGDLPNMMYLLIGDREILADHLGTELHVNGQMYLEKIIQVSLDLPVVGSWRIQQILFSGLDRIISPEPISRHFKVAHWQAVFPGLSPYFTDLRNVNRFLSTLDFHMRMFLSGSSFEINPVDLIATEAIRLFDPKLYRLLQERRNLLLGSEHSSSQVISEVAASIASLCEVVPEYRRNQIAGLMKTLFPAIAQASRGLGLGRHETAAWSRDLRVGSERHFDKYFELLEDPRELSNVDIHRFLAAPTRVAIREVLLGFQKRNLLDKTPARLREFESTIAIDKIPDVLLALCDVGDMISDKAPGMFTTSPYLQAEFLAGTLLDRLPANSIIDTIRETMLLSEGLNLHVDLLARVLRKADEGTLLFTLPAQEANELKAIATYSISRAAESGALVRSSAFRKLLSFWKLWSADDSKVRGYTEQLTASREGTVQFLNGMILTAHSSNPNKEGGSERYYILMSDLADFSDEDRIKKSLFAGEIDADFLRANAKVLYIYNRAVKRKEAGKGDYGLGGFDDDDD